MSNDTFPGYRRPDGSVGIRNYVLILPTSVCSNKVAQDISRQVKGSTWVNNNFGCCQVGSGARLTEKTLINVAKNPEMKRRMDIMRTYALTDATILISGESGTGKELLAQSLHNASQRANGPFVAINCGAVAPQILESELFGYVAGAFTGASPKRKTGLFELAHQGTLFLDEIGELDKPLQSRLLRVLQERQIMRLGSDRVIPIDIRIIAATNKKLPQLIEQGTFREDLYYRLNVLKATTLPLRERPEDVRAIGVYLLNEYCQRYQLPEMTLTPELWRTLGRATCVN